MRATFELLKASSLRAGSHGDDVNRGDFPAAGTFASDHRAFWISHKSNPATSLLQMASKVPSGR